jgi:hypothetical protein
LIIYLDGKLGVKQVQLFDMKKDPWEMKNIAPENPKIVKAMG